MANDVKPKSSSLELFPGIAYEVSKARGKVAFNNAIIAARIADAKAAKTVTRALAEVSIAQE